MSRRFIPTVDHCEARIVCDVALTDPQPLPDAGLVTTPLPSIPPEQTVGDILNPPVTPDPMDAVYIPPISTTVPYTPDPMDAIYIAPTSTPDPNTPTPTP